MKLVMLIRICLKETYRKVRVAKYLSDAFRVLTVLKHGDALTPPP